jgi:hypothetical protein
VGSFILSSCSSPAYHDRSFYSEAFDAERWYRIYLPLNYRQDEAKRYPVIYYFHGYGGRYKWDAYDVTDDINYPKNGRREPPFVMEWKQYVRDNEVIIVTWDGYEPNLQPGRKSREGIPYGNCRPYDYGRAHEQENNSWGWDYRPYFEELIDHVDQNFRTISDRDHRAITGLSMGGQTAYYIGGQSKDLISSVSAFDPADNVALYGSTEERAALPVLEMYRSLRGLPVRLTMTDGDWLKYNDWKLKQIFEAADLSKFEFQLSDYPNHWVSDADKQLDFHMQAFKNPRGLPQKWNHVSVTFPSFSVFGYEVESRRARPAITLMDHYSDQCIRIMSRTFIPTTSETYKPNTNYRLIALNLSTNQFASMHPTSSPAGRLSFELESGGYLVGIQEENANHHPIIQLVSKSNQDYYYFEQEQESHLDLKVTNLGLSPAREVNIRAFSDYPHIQFKNDVIRLEDLPSETLFDLPEPFTFVLSKDPHSTYISTISFELQVDGEPIDTQQIMFYPIPYSPMVDAADLIVLDGRSVQQLPIYQQGSDTIENKTVAGGQGNGNGLIEPGEDVLMLVKLANGMAPNDTNTYHRTYLINPFDSPFIEVNQLEYQEKKTQAGATSISSVISLSPDIPPREKIHLWLKVESLYNDKEDSTSNATIYAHQYHYRKNVMQVNF